MKTIIRWTLFAVLIGLVIGLVSNDNGASFWDGFVIGFTAIIGLFIFVTVFLFVIMPVFVPEIKNNFHKQ